MAKVIPIRGRARRLRSAARKTRGDRESELLKWMENSLRHMRKIDSRRRGLPAFPLSEYENLALELAHCGHAAFSHPGSATYLGVSLGVLHAAYVWDLARGLRLSAVKAKRPPAVIERMRQCERDARQALRRALGPVL